ncbi:lipopolysaccharide heptosyltransferase II [bacterium]|nr:MAG: lipopolysaccharide heptosyltransferase II [bacterium]
MRILIVEVNWLGDVLFSTPAIKALREKFPDSFIACLAVPRVREVLENNPCVNEIITNDEDGSYRGFWGRMKLAAQLRKKDFDLAIFFHRSFSRALTVYLSGVPRRVGYHTPKRALLLNDALPMPQKDSLHRVDYYLGIVKRLGCGIQDRNYEFFTSRNDDIFIEHFLAEEGIHNEDFLVCLNAGGNWGPKRWPQENFAKLADRLIEEYNAKVVFSGSKEDVGLVKAISGAMAHKPVIAAGKTSLSQLAALFRKVQLVVSADSGPLHIAASVGANLIALFGPTSAPVTGPVGKGAIRVIQKDISCTVPCYDKNCDDNKCMREITVDDVLSEVKKLSIKK